jgi:hypothetical protein
MKGTGAGVYGYGTRKKLSFSLGQYTIVFQVEVCAIKACAMEIMDGGHRNIYIVSESQGAIRALNSCQSNSEMVWDCHKSLAKLA